MNYQLSILKGIHPGLLISRELDKRQIKKSRFAMDIGEYPQTFSAITLGKRKMNTKLALKLEKNFGFEEGFLMVLQAYYDIKKEKQKGNTSRHPDFNRLRPILFWDTDMKKIDWESQKRAVIERIFARGNEKEKNEITRFYGKDTIDKIIHEQGKALL